MSIYDEAREILGDYIRPTVELDLSKLAKWQKESLENILIPILRTVPLSAILMGLNSKAAQILAMKRVKIKFNSKTIIPCNYYGITFMPSGK